MNAPPYWLLRTSVHGRGPRAFTARLFFVVKGILAIEMAGKSFSRTRENRPVWQQTFRGGIRRPHERAAKGLLRHDATNWMDLIHQLDARTRGPASGCPAVVMVQSTHDRTSNRLFVCLMRGKSGSARFRNLLCHPLMRPCLVKVRHIRMEHALELPLLNNQQMVEAFLPHAPQKPLTDGVGSWCMNRRLEQLDAAGPRHTSEAGPKFGIVITNEILRYSSIGGPRDAQRVF